MAYLPLSTANLPDPVIDPAQGSSPEDYFNTVLYTGTSDDSAKEITGVGFQPDFIWSKGRSGTYAVRNHFLRDAVRGANKNLHSNTTDAEATDSGNSFDVDGVTLSSDYGQNGLNTNHVLWSWKANGSGVSNTDGSITSTVSANTESGFSIVSYTGTGANATVGHGLDNDLDMLIVKNRDRSANWHTWHNALTGAQFLELSSTAAVGTDAPSWNSTVPTSTVFSVGTSNATNASGEDLIAYCFHSVEGFSKFGSYTGNGSTDGPFVYTGFKPAFVMVKATSGSESWNIVDDKRDNFNDGNNNLLFANLANSEASSSPHYIDFLSNGMKLSGNIGNWNTSGVTYIYMAFAENPFKYSTAR